MITACRLFGYSAVATFGATLILSFFLYMLNVPGSALSLTITGGVFGFIQGIFWALNK
ncbi:hypothetical protein NDAWWUGD_CDS0129 [Salmonella phage SeKF_80]